MKKRLLITSIVMMLVVAVALSTATYAWFTSNTRVDAQQVVLTAATADGDAILIAHNANGSDASSTITLAVHTGSALYPATPKAATSLTTFTENSISNIGANFQNLIMGGSGTYTDPSITTPNVSYYKDTFYVFNKGFQSRRLVPVVSIYYDATSNTAMMAAKSVRIAIVERTATNEVALGASVAGTSDANLSAYSLKGIWQFSTTAADDTVVEGDTHKNIAAKDGTALGSTTAASGYGVVAVLDGEEEPTGEYTQGNVAFTSNAFTLIPAATSGNQIAHEYTVIVWLEGWDEDCTNQITAGVFSVDVTFTAGA